MVYQSLYNRTLQGTCDRFNQLRTQSPKKKILTYYQVEKPDMFLEEARNLVEGISYPSEGILSHVVEQLKYLLAISGGDIRDKRILDLACGSKANHLILEPWLCRTLYILKDKLNIDLIGVDIEDNSSEEFKSYRTNLLEPNCLSYLPSSSVDIAHAGFLFGSGLLSRMGEEGENSSNVDRRAMENITGQLERILKPSGIFLYHYI